MSDINSIANWDTLGFIVDILIINVKQCKTLPRYFYDLGNVLTILILEYTSVVNENKKYIFISCIITFTNSKLEDDSIKDPF